MIDTAHGGTIDGVINGLNRILDLSVAEFRTEGGTLVVPGHGRISDAADVAYYRDMVVIIRDRIKSMIDREMTLDQVKAAKPTADYEPRYGAPTGRVDDGRLHHRGLQLAGRRPAAGSAAPPRWRASGAPAGAMTA